MISPISKAYLNTNPKRYPHDYVNLTRIKDNRIDFPKRTTFLSESAKEMLKQDILLDYKDACFIISIDGDYALIANLDLSFPLKKHEFVLPDVITGMVLNYQHYDTEAAPISVLTPQEIDFEAIIKQETHTHQVKLENNIIYVYTGSQAQGICQSLSGIESLYLADGHHRYLASQHILNKKHCLMMLSNLSSAKISSIQRSMPLQEPFEDSLAYLASESFQRVEGPVRPGVIEVMYQNEKMFFELQTLSQDVFSNHDVYRLHAQIISQGFKQYDSSQMDYSQVNQDDHVHFNTYPMKVSDLVYYSDLNISLPPKSTSIQPKSPSLLVFSQYPFKP